MLLTTAAGTSCEILYQHCDVSDAGQVQKSISELASKWDGIDVLVNNAAIQPVESFVPVPAAARPLP